MINWKMISLVESDKCLSQLPDFMHEEVSTYHDAFTSFNKENDGLDTTYFFTVGISKYIKLSMILKAVLTLSLRNASVKHRFSINKNLVDVNMSPESIIAQRLVKDHMIANNLTPSKTEISKEMLASVKRSRMRYAEPLEEKLQEKLTNEQQIQKELLQRDINNLEQKIKTLEKTCKLLGEELVSNMMKAEEKYNINYVVKGNALKRKSTEKKAEIKSYWYFSRNGRSCNCNLLTFPLMYVFL